MANSPLRCLPRMRCRRNAGSAVHYRAKIVSLENNMQAVRIARTCLKLPTPVQLWDASSRRMRPPRCIGTMKRLSKTQTWDLGAGCLQLQPGHSYGYLKSSSIPGTSQHAQHQTRTVASPWWFGGCRMVSHSNQGLKRSLKPPIHTNKRLPERGCLGFCQVASLQQPCRPRQLR